MNNILCPHCGSAEIFRFRRDSDWGGGSHYDTVNGDGYIEGKEYDTPDVDIYHCACCGMFFDPDFSMTTARVVTVDAILQRIENVKESLKWQEDNYNRRCDNVRKIVCGTPNTVMAEGGRHFKELPQMYAKITCCQEIVSNLEHIIQQDAVELTSVAQPVKYNLVKKSSAELRKDAKRYREEYPLGTRIALVKMNQEKHPVSPGTHGTIVEIDDIANFYMRWDNGRTLHLLPDVDEFRLLTEEEMFEEKRLSEFVDNIIEMMKPGHAAQTFVMPDETHGVNVVIDDSMGADNMAYVVEPCGFDYDTGTVTLTHTGSGKRVVYGDALALLNACLWVIANRLPGWEE